MFKVGDEIVTGGRRGTITSLDGSDAEIQVKIGKRLMVKRVPVHELLPPGFDEPSGEGSSDVQGRTVSGTAKPAAPERLDLDALFTNGTRFVSPSGREACVELKELGVLTLRGQATACDPGMLDAARPFEVAPAADEAFVTLARALGSNAAAKLAWSDEAPDRWEPALFDDGSHWFGVDGGQACFADFSRATEPANVGRIRGVSRNARGAFRFSADAEVILRGFKSGRGDGSYPCYLGLRGDEPVCIVADFYVLYESREVTLGFPDVRKYRSGRLVHPIFSDQDQQVRFENFGSRCEIEVVSTDSDIVWLHGHGFEVDSEIVGDDRGRVTSTYDLESGRRSTTNITLIVDPDLPDTAELRLHIAGASRAYQPA